MIREANSKLRVDSISTPLRKEHDYEVRLRIEYLFHYLIQQVTTPSNHLLPFFLPNPYKRLNSIDFHPQILPSLSLAQPRNLNCRHALPHLINQALGMWCVLQDTNESYSW